MAKSASPILLSGPDAVASEVDYLHQLGERVRAARARRGMTRKRLARDSGVSERYLAQLETGHGNISILLLRQVARALDLPLDILVHEGPEPPAEWRRAAEFLRQLPGPILAQAREALLRQFGGIESAVRNRRIALIGLRGAGKSTLGAKLAERLDVPFVELDREIEKEAGVSLGELFDLYGQPGFRRFERSSLDRVLVQHPAFVLATGGSLVSEAGTFERLLDTCFTVWLRAAPRDHMGRVVAQGDMRPMAQNREAMADLRRILESRTPLYAMADIQVDTAGCAIEEALGRLEDAVPHAADMHHLAK